MEEIVRMFDLSANVWQAAVLLVLADVMRVNGHDDAAQAVVSQTRMFSSVHSPRWCKSSDECLAPPRSESSGATPVNHRLAADEQQIADVFFTAMSTRPALLKRHASACFWIKLGARETAEITIRVADVRDGELKIAGPPWSSTSRKSCHADLFFRNTGGKTVRAAGAGAGKGATVGATMVSALM